MESLLESFADEPALVVGMLLGSIAILSALTIVLVAVRASIKSTREKEQTRREIAAYVAEGSITPQDAEILLSPSPWWLSSHARRKMKAGGASAMRSASRAMRDASRAVRSAGEGVGAGASAKDQPDY